MALSAYRTLLRSTRIAFAGDTRTLLASRVAARKGFEEDRGLQADSQEVQDKILYACEVAKVLRENVVQGEEMDGKPNTYKLNIHEHTELGDNNSIKEAGKNKGKNKNPLAGVKCSTI